MRELVFALEYAPGTNAVADILADNPETKIRSLSCHVSPKNLWRVDYVSGRKKLHSIISLRLSLTPSITPIVWPAVTAKRTGKHRSSTALTTHSSSTPTGHALPRVPPSHTSHSITSAMVSFSRRRGSVVATNGASSPPTTTPPTTHSATQSRARSTTRPALHLSVSATRMTPPRTTVPHIDGRTGCSGTGCRRPRVLQDTARDRNLRTRRETRYPRLDALLSAPPR